MSVFQRCAWILLILGLVMPKGVQGAPAESKRLHKVIVYPAESETPAELRAAGAEVEDYGSYWVVRAGKGQTEAIRKTRGARAVSADHLNRVELLSVQFDTTEGEPEVPAEFRETVKAHKRLRLVQFTGPVQPEWVEMLGATGAKIVHYVPNNAYIVRVTQAAEDNIRQFLAPNGPVQWIGVYHPYYKVQKGLIPSRRGKSDPIVALRVAVLDGPEAEATLAQIRQIARGATSEPFVQLDAKIVQFAALTSEISKIAQMADVLWIERVVPKATKDEKQGLILASRTNQLPAHSPIPATLGGERYLDFLFDRVGGGLAAFTNSATYPIVDIADTGLELGSRRPVHPAFYDRGDRSRDSRVVYATRAGFPNGEGCPPFSEFFNGAEDFCGHGTFVASIIAGYDNGADETVFGCTDTFAVPTCVLVGDDVVCVPSFATEMLDLELVRKDTEGFQRGMGISPFGLIGTTRIFSQDLIFECAAYAPVPDCLFCATSLPILMAQSYLNRARISNNSWGDILLATPDGTIVNAGLYTVDSQSYDIGVRDALLTGTATNVPGPSPLNQEMIAVFAGGNAGSVGNVGGFGDILVTAPATAKNIIAVGATENFRTTGDGCFTAVEQDNTFDISGYSAFGPTLDGRFKPDILAPGSAIFGANNFLAFDQVIEACTCQPGVRVTECHPVPGIQVCLNTAPRWPREPGLYTCGAGTSFSAPAVSGGVQLLWWYFQNRLNLLQPSPAMAKAYLLNSARYLPIVNPITQTMDTLPSSAQGMGMMDLERMFDGVPRALRDQTAPRAIDVTLLLTNPIPQQTYFSRTGQSYEFSGTIFDATKPFRVTVAWTDAPGTPAANGSLVNNLDLEVTVGGRLYRGNIFAGQFSVIDLNRGADEINNVESVFLPAGQTGTWSVVVRAANLTGDGTPNVGTTTDQDFALVVYNTTTPSDVPNLNTNDTCQTATPIVSFPYTATLNLSSPTFHNNHPSPSAARGGIDAFWSLGRLSRGTQISADTFGSNFDTVLSVWQGDCGSLVEVTSNNNISNTLQSAVSFTADGVSVYYLVVDKRAGAGNSLTLNVRAVPPPISLLPTTVDFGSVLVGAESSIQNLTYTNGSTQAARIEGVTIEGANPEDFILFEENCDGQTIPPGGVCTLRIVFAPQGEGTRTATLVVTDNQTGSPRLAVLTGIGLPPSPRVCRSTSTLNFGTVDIGTSSAAQTVTLTNCGTAALFITNATLTGVAAADYSITANSCSGSFVPPGGLCQVSVVFSPSAAGNRNATLRFNHNADTSPESISLNGIGKQPAPAVCLSAAALNFGNVDVGGNSSILSLVVTNCGSAALNITGVALTGPGAGQFAIVGDTCSGSSLSPGQTCTIQVQMQPSVIGPISATLEIAHNANGSPHRVSLTGVGSGSQPDALISRSRRPQTFVGDNVYNNTGALQEAGVTARRGARRVFYVKVQNDGNAPDSFRVQGTGNVPQGISVRYLLGAARREALDITNAVLAGTFTTSTLAPGAMTGDATLIRVEVTVDKLAFSGFYETDITFSSVARPDRSDTVKATVVVQ